MRSLAIWEAQEAMEEAVFIRENGCPGFLASGGTRREIAPVQLKNYEREEEIAENAT
jgi:hypothetical protein